MRKKLQDYLPPILLKTYEFPLLCDTEQPEIDRLRDAADAVLDAQFISTAGETAIARYEKIFKITPMDTDTLDERRFRVLAKINAQLPFSVRRLRQQLPDKTVWAFSGYTWEELTGQSRARCEATGALLSLVDVLVDGEFVEALRDISLRFRGSSNQRLLDVPASLAAGRPIPWEG